MAENPFESFLTGMIGGATAGARRRTMVEQGQQAAGAAEDFFGGGPIDPPKAPGMGATFLAGLQLARTLPTTPGQKLQADQVKLQAANYALQRKTAEDRQAAIDAQNYYKNAVEAKEAEDNLHDAVLLNEKFNLINTAAKLGSTSSIYSVTAEKGEFKSPDSYEDLNKYKNDVLNLQSTRKSSEVHGFRERLIDTGYVPEEVALMPRWKVEQSIKMEDDRFEDVEARAMLLPYEEGQDLLYRIKTPGSMQDRSEALSEIYSATSSLALGSSPLAKIYQGRQAAQADNLDIKPWDNLIAKITSGDASPGMSIQLPDGTKVTLDGSPAVDDKAVARETLVEIPQQLALLNSVERLIGEMSSEEMGPTGMVRGVVGGLAIKADSIAKAVGVDIVPEFLTDLYSKDIEKLRSTAGALSQSIKGAVRTDTGPISNYEDIRLSKVTSILDNPTSTKEQIDDAIVTLRDILNVKQFVNTSVLGRTPDLLNRLPDYDSGMRYLRYIKGQLSQESGGGNRRGTSVPIISQEDFNRYREFFAVKFPDRHQQIVELQKKARP